MWTDAIEVHTALVEAEDWVARVQAASPGLLRSPVLGGSPVLVCILGFTETALLPGISAAGATPADRRYTAIADAEFLWCGPDGLPRYRLPPLQAGLSPVLITRALWELQRWPLYILDAGLAIPPAVPHESLGGEVARCLSSGQALALKGVMELFARGWAWGDRLVQEHPGDWLILGECVVGGTTTALGVLEGLGIAAAGKICSSHVQTNHDQKITLVRQGLERANLGPNPHPAAVVAAVGDPMQVVAAALALRCSQSMPVLLGGGTQMLAVYALAAAWAEREALPWQSRAIAVGTTAWVMQDPSSDAQGLAALIGDRWGAIPLLSTRLSFAQSRHPALQRYEQGFVKEGVAAGASAIATSLTLGLNPQELLSAIDALTDRYMTWRTRL